MNYLAHTLLGAPDGERIVGQMLGDFAAGVDLQKLRPGVRHGVLRHRAIDAFTDAHPIVRAAKARFEPPFRRFAGIIVDVAFDHFLARHFDRFSEIELSEFTRSVYAALDAHGDQLSPRLAQVLPSMTRHDWLASYTQLENVERAFHGLARRIRRENPLSRAIEPVRADYAALERDFEEFFPELLRFEREASSGGEQSVE